MTKRMCVFGLLICICSFTALYAQLTRFFPGDEMLPSSFLSDLFQDSQGNVWIATNGGLVRYDGHQFRTYRHVEGQEASLLSDHTLRLVEDGNKRLVVGTAMGTQRFDPATLRFSTVKLVNSQGTEISCFINALLLRRNGDVLITTSGYGVYVLKPDAEQATHGDEFMDDIFEDVRDVAETVEGNLWMAANQNGVLRMEGNRLHTYSIGEHQARNICVSRSGRVYASDLLGGLYLFDKKSDQFVCVEATRHLSINRLVDAMDGGVFLATDGIGLMRYDEKTGEVSAVGWSQGYVDMSRAKVKTVMEDGVGNLWMGVDQRGLFMQTGGNMGFDYMGVRQGKASLIGDHGVLTMYGDKDGTLWVGTDGDGLYRLTADGQSRHYDNVPSSILSICADHEGRLYLASWLEGCGRFDPQTGRYEQFPFTKAGDATHVMSMVVDKDDNLWIATSGDGLKCWNPRSQQLEEYRPKKEQDPNFKDNALSNSWLEHLSLSNDGKRLYMALSSGMACMELSTRSFVSTWGKCCLLPGMAVNAVCEDTEGKVWAATSEGLYMLLPNSHEMQHYGVEHGLPSMALMSMEQAEDGTLWIGTQHGLCHFFPQNGECINYFKAEGLQGNEFIKGASARLGDGRLAFGGTSGLTIFHSADIKPLHPRLRVNLVGMTVAGEEVNTLTRSGWYQVTDVMLSEATRFDLAHDDNNITLRFSVMDYARADGVRYEYAIGDGEWTSLPVGTNVLTMTHLPADTYELRVRAVLGSIVGDERSFLIVVHSAWYASWWAMCVYALLVVLLVWLYLQYRRRAKQSRLRMQEHIHAALMRHAVEDAEKEGGTEKPMAGRTVATDLSRAKTSDEQLMERVMQVIRCHIGNPNLSVEQLADEVGASHWQLFRKIKELTGDSPRAFVKNVRLKRAAYLLEDGTRSIDDVMRACGFDNTAEFSAIFKKFYGVSPSEYMREAALEVGRDSQMK